MSTPTPPAGIIYQSEFDTYSNDWLSIVTDESRANELRDCFRYPGIKAQNINFVRFSTLQIAQLVSTVGASNIKARFLVVRDNNKDVYPTGYPHFALALFATDNLNGRLSAYYISHFYWQPQDSPEFTQDEYWHEDSSTAAPVEFTPGQLPDALATYWQQNWSPPGDDPNATQAMFDSTYGYLRGYTFGLDDFIMPLTSIPLGKTIKTASPIRINFGLHQYYPATPGVQELHSTFGLMVSYVAPHKHKRKYKGSEEHLPDDNHGGFNEHVGDPIDDTDVFYDLAHPCPPTC